MTTARNRESARFIRRIGCLLSGYIFSSILPYNFFFVTHNVKYFIFEHRLEIKGLRRNPASEKYCTKSEDEIVYPGMEWADVDGKRFLWSEEGKMMSGHVSKHGLEKLVELINLNPLSFTERNRSA